VFGEIFICQFPFSSGAFSKPRPALVLFDLGQDALICRVTSVLRSGPLDVAITDWANAGLVKPSVARLDRLVTAEKAILGRRLGILSPSDQSAVRMAWNQFMRL
jgi:mRNA-degrading endonuclease toxin of MazEF toxin-antitoxin module